MADNNVTDYPRALHPLHAILLAFPLPLFLGTLLSDLAYSSTYEVQWTNFASWLIAGAMLTGALVTLWALIECLVSGRQRTGKHFAYLVVLLVMMAVGFINALVHAKDGWAAMPAGLWLSVVVTLLALIASWIGYAGLRAREVAHAR